MNPSNIPSDNLLMEIDGRGLHAARHILRYAYHKTGISPVVLRRAPRLLLAMTFAILPVIATTTTNLANAAYWFWAVTLLLPMISDISDIRGDWTMAKQEKYYLLAAVAEQHYIFRSVLGLLSITFTALVIVLGLIYGWPALSSPHFAAAFLIAFLIGAHLWIEAAILPLPRPATED